MTRARQALVFILAVCIVSVVILGVFGFKTLSLPEETLRSVESEIVVASYNTKICAASEEQLFGIKKQLADYDVDLVGLQEIDNYAKRSGYVDFLQELQNDKLSQSFFSPSMSKSFGGNYGVGTLSAFEIIERKNIPLPYPELGNESLSFIIERRVCSRTLVSVNGIKLAFYNTHLSFESEELRRPQFIKIVEAMNADTVEHKILVGDFNDDFTDYRFYFDPNYNLLNDEATPYVTYRSLGSRLDNIIYTKNLELLDGGMVESNYSDHNMLYAKFRLTGREN